MPPKAFPTPKGSATKTSKVSHSTLAKASPLKASKNATTSDKDIVFLLNCVKLNPNTLDWKAIGDAMELSGPAVRMRIARLRAKMEKEADESSCENAADAGSADTKEVTE